MPAKVKPQISKQRHVLEYDANWEFTGLRQLGSNCLKTEAFSPIHNVNVAFCFELYYHDFCGHSNYIEYSCFKLNLVKLFGSDIPNHLEMKMDVKVEYSNYTLFKEYKIPPLKVAQVDIFNFPNVISELKRDAYEPSEHGFAINSGGLNLYCHMTFNDSLFSPKLLSHYQVWVDNVQNFAEDFKNIYEPNVLSDITIEVEGKSFPAHKAILAAHSPVFLKMLTSDFLESKANRIEIKDVTSHNFEYFLKYLYSGKIENSTFDTTIALYSLAHIYDVNSLKHECALSVTKDLSIDTVCDVLKMAYHYDDNSLKKAAIQFAASVMEDLISTENWKQLIEKFPIAGYEVMLHFYPKKQKAE